MELAPAIDIPEVGGRAFDSFIMKEYINGVNHAYGIRDSKKYHISFASLAEAYGYSLQDVQMPEPIAETLVNHESDAEETPAVQLAGALATAHTIEDIKFAPTRHGLFSKVKNRVESWIDSAIDSAQEALSRRRTLAGLGAAALAATSIFIPLTSPGPTVSAASAPRIGAPAKGGELINTTTTTTTNPETSAQTALNTAITNALPSIGLQQGEYTPLSVSGDGAFDGPIVANYYSLDHGPAAWNGIPHTVDGAEQLSQNLLNARDGFTASDASVALQSMEHFGDMPASIVAALTAGDYSNVGLQVLSLEGQSVDYHNMTWNDNGQLAVEADRVVSPATGDVIALISYVDANGNTQVQAFRVDCGGTNTQSFESLTIVPNETPPTPVVTPSTTTTTRPNTPHPTSTTTSTTFIGPKGPSHPPVTGGSTTTQPATNPGGPVPTTSTTTTTRPTGETTTTIRVSGSTTTTAAGGGYSG